MFSQFQSIINQLTDSESIDQKAKRLGVPVISPRPDIPKDQNPITAICGQCGAELRRVMHFYCGNGNCPVQPRVTL